ncbi:MAG: hypothetical protein ACKOW2_02145 [Sphingobacteriaceae bacterium]
MELSDWLATTGVSLLLIAFFLNLFKRLDTTHRAYGLMNAAGAGLCGISAYLISFYPFVVLEGVWVLVSLFSLIRNVPRGTR